MANVHITLCINHRGRFERGPCGKLGYVGGEVTEIERVNVDILNEFFINDLLRDIGYTSITDFYWLEPSKELDNGLKLLRVDMDIVKLYETAVKNGNRIYLYTEHPINDPVIVEENITPSKVRLKTCAKRNPTPKKTPRRRLMDGEVQNRKEVHKASSQIEVESQKEDVVNVAQQISSAKQMSQPPTTPMQPDEAPSNQSHPSQNSIEQEQQPIHTAGSTSPSAVFVSLSSENEAQAAEQVIQYILQPYRNPLSQSNPESDPVPPSDTNSTPQNNQTNTDEQVEGRPKVSKRRSAKMPPPTGQFFIPNPDPDKLPSIYVPVESEEFSDENAGYHCYESEELRSIASDEDADQPPVFPQSNTDAPVSQVRLELGMEFETLSHFRKAVRKFNINIGMSIFFSRCDSTRSKAICYDEECPWQIYCAKRSFPLSYQVKTFVNEHTCSRETIVSQLTENGL
ncbi:uncharacterized protein LOC107616092 [Arachis ipaensis]|uniref:uncharacterized protein LOC107616092 n=1 Tax=Arachis ipaensis TaxID=130454 RepID=UPI0007AFDEC8|nr:uncharacterized protein LOC107616092 [Arachis ipaensis]